MSTAWMQEAEQSNAASNCREQLYAIILALLLSYFSYRYNSSLI
jgi:hypothetical protein